MKEDERGWNLNGRGNVQEQIKRKRKRVRLHCVVFVIVLRHTLIFINVLQT